MKKILKSLSIIVAVAAVVVGGTVAYFNDTEVSEDNVITAGTIDIEVNDQNPWSQNGKYTFSNLEPSDDVDIDVVLKNVGTNPVVIWKKVEVDENTGETSEPECVAIGGSWDDTNNTCDKDDTNDVSTQFVYSMDINSSVNIDEAWDVRVSDIDGLWIPMGRLNSGDTLDVDQNYYFDENAGNEYQGDEMTIDVTFYAEQLDAPGPANTTNGVVLDNKDVASGDWEPEVGDGIWGIITWDGADNYNVRAWGLEGASYQVAHYDEATSTQTLMGDVLTPDANGDVEDDDVLTAKGNDSKYWLRDLSWDNDNTLWEANLVDN